MSGKVSDSVCFVEIKAQDLGRCRVCASSELVVFPRSWASEPISEGCDKAGWSDGIQEHDLSSKQAGNDLGIRCSQGEQRS